MELSELSDHPDTPLSEPIQTRKFDKKDTNPAPVLINSKILDTVHWKRLVRDLKANEKNYPGITKTSCKTVAIGIQGIS